MKIALIALVVVLLFDARASEVALYTLGDSPVVDGVACERPSPDWAGIAHVLGGWAVTNELGCAWRMDASEEACLLVPLPAKGDVQVRVLARGAALTATVLNNRFDPLGDSISFQLVDVGEWSVTVPQQVGAVWLTIAPFVGSAYVAEVALSVAEGETLHPLSMDENETLFDGDSVLSAPVAGLESGLLGEYFDLSDAVIPLEKLPDLSGRLPICVRGESNICFSASAERWLGVPTSVPVDNFALRLTGFIRIPADGVYTFILRSDDGSMLFIDGTLVVENDGAHSVREKSGARRLSAGLHPIEVRFFDAEEFAELALFWVAPGLPREAVPASVFFRSREALVRPRVCVAWPKENAVAWSGEELQLTAEAESSAGIASVGFVADGKWIGMGERVLGTGRWTYTWDGVPVGDRFVCAVATGVDGLVTTSSVRRIRRVDIPPGYAHGLKADFYRLSRVQDGMPELDTATPFQSGVVESVGHPLTTAAWAMMPSNVVNNFAVLFTGVLWVTEPGLYEFAIGSDDGARLMVDGATIVDDSSPHAFRTRKGTAALGIGMHNLRVEFYENAGEAGLSLSWGRQGASLESVAAPYLLHRTGVADGDGDGMEDWWETLFGLNPDDPADAMDDIDGDGLTNLAEFCAGTNPLKADTDGDGLPDGWEIRWGLNPVLDDALEDPDGDGLANLDEFRAGSSPYLVDTDGDGLSDYEEFWELGTCPTEVDAIRRGGAFAASVGRPSLEFSVVTTGVYSVSATIVHAWRDDGRTKARVSLADRVLFFVDGCFVAHRDVPVNAQKPTEVVFHTPVLGEGSHTISVHHACPDFRLWTTVGSLSVVSVSGIDIATIVCRRSSVRQAPSASRVSPAYIEGTAHFPERVTASCGKVGLCGDESWYLDLPLSMTEGVESEIVFEHLVSTNVAVVWKPTNLFLEDEPLTIRAGASLLLAGGPTDGADGWVDVVTNGVRVCGYGVGGRTTLTFASSGEYALSAVWCSMSAGGVVLTSAVSTVTVMGGQFPSQPPVCVVGETRAWACPNLPPSCFVEGDRRTRVGRLSETDLSLLTLDTRGNRTVTARLWAGGPVLDSIRIVPIWAVAAYGNTSYAIETNEFGTICRTYLMQDGADSTVRFKIRSYTASVLLDDLSLVRTIGAETFDSDGRYAYDLIKPDTIASPCHLVRIYQGTTEIGEAVYGTGELPAELRELEVK